MKGGRNADASPADPGPSGASALRACGRFALAVGALSACQGSPVDTRAIWIDKGAERVRVYDRGSLGALNYAAVPISGEADPRLQLGPQGRLLLARNGPVDEGGELHDLEGGRRWKLALPPLRVGVDDPVHFTPRGDALYWVGRTCTTAACSPFALWAIAVGRERRLPTDARTWPVISAGPIDGFSQVFAAADAPVLLNAGPGEITAYRYPVGGDEANRLQELDRRSASFDVNGRAATRCPFPDWCGTRTAMSPDGDAAFFSVGPEVCESRIMRWTIGEVPACEALPPDLVGASLLAALSANHLVFSDDRRVYLWDRLARPTQRVPVLGDGDYFIETAASGRVLIFGAFDGPTLRITKDGARILSTATTRCSDPASPVVSPQGTWVAWNCGSAPDVQLGENFASAVVRVHDGSLERHPGVPSWPIAIDEDGDLLFATTDQSSEVIPEDLPFPSDAEGGFGTSEGVLDWGGEGEDWGEETGTGDEGNTGGPDNLGDPLGGGSVEALPPRPRTLYTLSGDGIIRRVSDMEPTPIATKLSAAGVSTFVQAGG